MPQGKTAAVHACTFEPAKQQWNKCKQSIEVSKNGLSEHQEDSLTASRSCAADPHATNGGIQSEPRRQLSVKSLLDIEAACTCGRGRMLEPTLEHETGERVRGRIKGQFGVLRQHPMDNIEMLLKDLDT